VKRREFIALIGGATVAWPLSAHAQQQPMPVIGFLNSASPDAFAPFVSSFLHGLETVGFVDGQNVVVEHRTAEGQPDRLPALAAEMVRRPVTVLVAISTASALALKQATSSLPIVFLTGSDPVELGLVASFNRPGGNATGVSFLVNKLGEKRLELLSELTPDATALGILVDAGNPNAPSDTKAAQLAAQKIGRRLVIVTVGSKGELEAAFMTLVQQQVSALFVAANVNFIAWRDQIIALAARHRIAASYSGREFVALGGLMSYGPNQADMIRQVGMYTGRILKGSNPADMPVMQPSRFEFVLNLKTANALGLIVPNSMQLLADEVIE
jgi:putative tryptophan/tyrosine transport system substrate-binding protein